MSSPSVVPLDSTVGPAEMAAMQEEERDGSAVASDASSTLTATPATAAVSYENVPPLDIAALAPAADDDEDRPFAPQQDPPGLSPAHSDDPFANIAPLEIPKESPPKRVQIGGALTSSFEDSGRNSPSAFARAGRKRMSVIDTLHAQYDRAGSKSPNRGPLVGPQTGGEAALAAEDSFAARGRRRASIADATQLMDANSSKNPSAAIDHAAIGRHEFANIQHMFTKYDEDGSGAIDTKELRQVMLSLGHQLTDQQLDDLIFEITGSKSVTELDFEDFVKLILFWKDAARFRLFERETAAQTEHIEQAVNTSGKVLPDHAIRRWWDVVMLAVMVFIWGTVTFYYCIVNDSDAIDRYRSYLMPMEIVASVLMVLDIAVTLTTVRIEGRHIITDTRAILQWYARTYLASDAVSILPYWLMIPSPAAGYVNWIRVARFVKLPALFATSGRLPMDPSFVTFYYQLLPLIESSCFFFSLVHTAGVIMIYLQPDRAQALNYSSAIYWAMLLISSVGSDVVPGTNDTDGKRWYSMIVMIIGQLVNAVAVGNIVRYFQIADISAVRAGKLAETAAVCQYFSIPEALQNEILQFQDHVLQHNLSVAYFQLIKGLPTEMKVHIGIYARIRLISGHPIFRLGHEAVRVAVAQALDSVVYTPEEYVVIVEDVDDDMFIVAHGFLDVLSKRSGYVMTLKPGDHFGEIALFHEVPHSVSVKTLTYCELFALSGQAFDAIMERFPTFRRSVDTMLADFRDNPRDTDVLRMELGAASTLGGSSSFDGSNSMSPTNRDGDLFYLNDLSFLAKDRTERIRERRATLMEQIAKEDEEMLLASSMNMQEQTDAQRADAGDGGGGDLQGGSRTTSAAFGQEGDTDVIPFVPGEPTMSMEVVPLSSKSARRTSARHGSQVDFGEHSGRRASGGAPQTPRRKWAPVKLGAITAEDATTPTSARRRKISAANEAWGADPDAPAPNVSEYSMRRQTSGDVDPADLPASRPSISPRAAAAFAAESQRLSISVAALHHSHSSPQHSQPAAEAVGTDADALARTFKGKSRLTERKRAGREHDLTAQAQDELTRELTGVTSVVLSENGVTSPFAVSPRQSFAVPTAHAFVSGAHGGLAGSGDAGDLSTDFGANWMNEAAVPSSMQAQVVDTLITEIAGQMADVNKLIAKLNPAAAALHGSVDTSPIAIVPTMPTPTTTASASPATTVALPSSAASPMPSAGLAHPRHMSSDASPSSRTFAPPPPLALHRVQSTNGLTTSGSMEATPHREGFGLRRARSGKHGVWAGAAVMAGTTDGSGSTEGQPPPPQRAETMSSIPPRSARSQQRIPGVIPSQNDSVHDDRTSAATSSRNSTSGQSPPPHHAGPGLDQY